MKHPVQVLFLLYTKQVISKGLSPWIVISENIKLSDIRSVGKHSPGTYWLYLADTEYLF